MQNRIEVRIEPREDWLIETDVANAIKKEPVLNASRIRVEANNGAVILSGMVNSRHRKYLAEALAKGVVGVVQVENQIRFSRMAVRRDEDILADVLSRIKWDPALMSPELDIGVENGKVTMKGLVESAQARQRAYRDGWVPGVENVDVSAVQITSAEHTAYEGPLEYQHSPDGPPSRNTRK